MQKAMNPLTDYLAFGDDVLKYIPQRPPMVMINGIHKATETSITTTFQVLADNVLVEDGCLTEAGLIENIAQSAAALTGYAALSDNKKVLLGFIGAVKRLKITGNPQVGTWLETKVEVINQVFDYSIVKGEVFAEEKLIAECEMNIFLQPNH
jgi:predicted hotdog family 3-hydroxylacyl-ACP dehydratase